MSELRAVKWNGADAESPDFDGFADGETWNGFDVIYVTPEQRETVREHWYTAGTECCPHPLADHVSRPTGQYVAGYAITTDPECIRCDCLSFDDGASNITAEPVITEGPYAGLISLLGYCTTIAASEHTYHGGAAGSFAAEGCEECIVAEDTCPDCGHSIDVDHDLRAADGCAGCIKCMEVN